MAQEGNITVRWAARGELPGVDLSWQLYLDGAKIGQGALCAKPGDEQALIPITPPAARVAHHPAMAVSNQGHRYRQRP